MHNDADATYHPGMSVLFQDNAERLIEFVCLSNGLSRGVDNGKITALLDDRSYDVCFKTNKEQDQRDDLRATVLATARALVKT